MSNPSWVLNVRLCLNNPCKASSPVELCRESRLHQRISHIKLRTVNMYLFIFTLGMCINTTGKACSVSQNQRLCAHRWSAPVPDMFPKHNSGGEI